MQLTYEKCLCLVNSMIDAGILQTDYNPGRGEGVYIYREAGMFSPEGWYFTPVEGVAYELSESLKKQKALRDTLWNSGIQLPLSAFYV